MIAKHGGKGVVIKSRAPKKEENILD